MFGVESPLGESDEELRYFFDAVVQDVRHQCPAEAEYQLDGWFARGGRTYRKVRFSEGEMPAAILDLALDIGLPRRLIDCARVEGMMVGYEIWERAMEQFDYVEIRDR